MSALPDFYPELVERIRARLVADPEHPGCQVFPQKPGRHARIKYRGKLYSPHRVIAEWKAGRLAPRSFDARHSCDNPPCANPDHLEIGTRRENVMDAVAKGRLRAPRVVATDAERARRAALARSLPRCGKCERFLPRTGNCKSCGGPREAEPIYTSRLDSVRAWLAARRPASLGVRS